MFRQCDRRFPFLWESNDQPPARWHGPGDGPVQYFASTPDGAWAEFIRHEEIVDPIDLAGVSRAMWVVEIEAEDFAVAELPTEELEGGLASYGACRQEARRLRAEGRTALSTPSAALEAGAAGGLRVELGFRAAPAADGVVFVLFGTRPFAVGWLAVEDGKPSPALLENVRHL